MARGSRWSGAIRPGSMKPSHGTRCRAEAPTIAAYQADFSSLDSVRALAEELRAAYPHIDVLANNAGGAFSSRVITADGFEQTIQVNHLAPFLLTAPAPRSARRRAGDRDRVRRAPGRAARSGRSELVRAVPDVHRVRVGQAGEHPVRGRGGAALAGDRVVQLPPRRGANPVRPGQRAGQHVLQALAVPAVAGEGRGHDALAGVGAVVGADQRWLLRQAQAEAAVGRRPGAPSLAAALWEASEPTAVKG